MTGSIDQQTTSPRSAGAALPRACDFPGCPEDGVHRAPKSRDRLRDYHWFCLAHVRLYNEAWNFYQGMTEIEIEVERRSDAVWQRPTWPLGGDGPGFRSWRREELRDGFGFFDGEDGSRQNGHGKNQTRQPEAPQDEDQAALAALDLRQPVTFQTIRVRYKELAKQLHPDANGGDKEAENRLKDVTRAYATLKASYGQRA